VNIVTPSQHPTIDDSQAPRSSIAQDSLGAAPAEVLTRKMLEDILAALPVGVFVVDASGSPCYANRASLRLLGQGAEPGTAAEDIAAVYQAFVAGTDDLYPTDQVPVVRAVKGENSHIENMEIRTPDGVIGLEVWGTPVPDAKGGTSHGVAVFADITARKQAESSLNEAERLAHLGSWALDVTTRGLTCSPELLRLFGFGTGEVPAYDALVDRVHVEDRQATAAAMRTAIESGKPFVLEYRLQLPSGVLRWIRGRGRVDAAVGGAPLRVLGTAQDITEEKEVRDALWLEASHDPLSGLPNRNHLLTQMQAALARLDDQPAVVGVLYLGIDRFQLINASLGLPIGDQLLCATASRIEEVLPSECLLARVGGDEFGVLCEGQDAAGVLALADRVCAAMKAPIQWESGHLVMSVSAGVAHATSASLAPHELLRDANAAMLVAKNSGRARSAVFEPSLRAKAIGRLDTEVALRRSITDGDLEVYYQQIVTLTDGRPVGHEALVRWNHPRRGLIGPDEFIAIAEETGLIVPLGAWVMRQACIQARRFQRLDPRWARLTMSVNLSGGQLNQPDLVEMIAGALRAADLRSCDLQLEMTESVLMNDAVTTIAVLQQLKGLGLRLAIDDFGTGFSSLAYLRRFPVDVLKIDRTFVNGLGQDLEDSAVAATVVSLADTLGLSTVAEGVETELQRDCLLGLGCERAQGYLFARPVSASDAETTLVTAAIVGG